MTYNIPILLLPQTKAVLKKLTRAHQARGGKCLLKLIKRFLRKPVSTAEIYDLEKAFNHIKHEKTEGNDGNFTGAVFNNISFGDLWVKLHDVGLDFSDFHFQKCVFSKATFSGMINYATFTECIFDGAIFESFEFDNCTFIEKEEVISDEDFIFYTPSNTFNGCDLRKVTFQNSDPAYLKGIDFYGAIISRQTFEIGTESKVLSIRGAIYTEPLILPDLTADFDDINFIGNGFGAYTKSDDNVLKAKDVDFAGITLLRTTFQDCSLMGSRFYKNDLSGVTFHGSNLQSVIFAEESDDGRMVESKNLESKALAGTNLLGTTLPSYLGDFKSALEAEADAASNARKLFVILLPLCFYVFSAVVFGTKRNELTLPFTGVTFNMASFTAVASITITALYIYFHLYLQKIWDQLECLPAIFPNGAPLWNRISPWMFSVLAWQHIPRLKEILDKTKSHTNSPNQLRALWRTPKNYCLQKWACIFLGYVAPVLLVTGLYGDIFFFHPHTNSDLPKFTMVFVLAIMWGALVHFLNNIEKSFRNEPDVQSGALRWKIGAWSIMSILLICNLSILINPMVKNRPASPIIIAEIS